MNEVTVQGGGEDKVTFKGYDKACGDSDTHI